jgi:hypothetical protein
MANSPKRDAAKALYTAIELVLHKECDKYVGDAKNVFRYHVQRHTAKLLPKLAKAAGMYQSEKDIRIGDKLIHEAFGHGTVTEVFDDGFIAVDFAKAGPKKFVAKLAITKITRTKQGAILSAAVNPSSSRKEPQTVFEWRKGPNARKPVNPDKKTRFWKYPCGGAGCQNIISKMSRSGFCRSCSYSCARSPVQAIRDEAARLGRELTRVERLAVHRRDRLARGLCPECCMEPVKPGYYRCVYCLVATASRKRRRNKRQPSLPVAVK